MRRRWMLWMAGFTLMTVVGLLFAWQMMRPTHRIQKGNIEKIERGMTLAEVEAILGVPSGDHSTRKVIVACEPAASNFVLMGGPSKTWISNEASARIYFDGNNCVLGVIVDDVMVQDESWWARLSCWLRIEPRSQPSNGYAY